MSGRFRHLPPLDTLIAFESVARLGSFTRAADELCVTQSAVSKQVRTLEQALGVALFMRGARGVELSTAGVLYQQEVVPALQRIHVTGQRISTTHHPNTVTVLATHAVSQFWLFPRLLSFNAVHPEITIHIHASNEIMPFMVPDHDLAILYGGGDWPSLEATALIPEVIYPVARPGVAGSAAKTLEELAGLPLIQLASAWDCIEWRDWFAHFDIAYQSPKSDPTFNQLTLTYAAIQQGGGIGLVWDFMAAEAINKGELVRVTDFLVETGLAEFVVHDLVRPMSAATTLFRDWLIEGATNRCIPSPRSEV
ncbi:LysR substrate-binding domain-containing protein [Pseudomonas sp. CC6-YY-74]|uniref:LysR substrate-binding domain-containing protein n=1 Tax=Pseudomonas sp. CC6-YY-74 TaxID=1930532 RepID=UPI0009A21C68|nr:LysR substrate-binding domain-containing protein [Pseudomonas sp. CC6-YY-74]